MSSPDCVVLCCVVFDRSVHKCLGDSLTILPRLKRTKLRHLQYTQYPEIFSVVGHICK